MLVARARRGDAEAAEALVRRHLRAVYSVALAIVRRPADAEDLAQDSMIAALEKLDSCRQPERFSAWLLQIVRNRARNALNVRRLREPADCDDTLPDPSCHADALDLSRAQLLRALEGLTPTQREVVLLHDLEQWTHAEIANSLEISEVNSRQHLFQARRALRERLDTEDSHGS